MASFKAHEEITKGKNESSGGQLMFIKEEWEKKECEEGKLLYTRVEWLKQKGRTGRYNQYEGTS